MLLLLIEFILCSSDSRQVSVIYVATKKEKCQIDTCYELCDSDCELKTFTSEIWQSNENKKKVLNLSKKRSSVNCDKIVAFNKFNRKSSSINNNRILVLFFSITKCIVFFFFAIQNENRDLKYSGIALKLMLNALINYVAIMKLFLKWAKLGKIVHFEISLVKQITTHSSSGEIT